MPRLALPDDFDEVLEMSYKFLNSVVYKNYYTTNAVESMIRDTLTHVYNRNTVIFLEPGAGIIAGLACPFLYGECLVASELAWWVEPTMRSTKVGKELMDAFEDWARNEGCKLITMISIDDTLGKYYEKRGYSLYEHAYMKELS